MAKSNSFKTLKKRKIQERKSLEQDKKELEIENNDIELSWKSTSLPKIQETVTHWTYEWDEFWETNRDLDWSSMFSNFDWIEKEKEDEDNENIETLLWESENNLDDDFSFDNIWSLEDNETNDDNLFWDLWLSLDDFDEEVKEAEEKAKKDWTYEKQIQEFEEEKNLEEVKEIEDDFSFDDDIEDKIVWEFDEWKKRREDKEIKNDEDEEFEWLPSFDEAVDYDEAIEQAQFEWNWDETEHSSIYDEELDEEQKKIWYLLKNWLDSWINLWNKQEKIEDEEDDISFDSSDNEEEKTDNELDFDDFSFDEENEENEESEENENIKIDEEDENKDDQEENEEEKNDESDEEDNELNFDDFSFDDEDENSVNNEDYEEDENDEEFKEENNYNEKFDEEEENDNSDEELNFEDEYENSLEEQEYDNNNEELKFEEQENDDEDNEEEKKDLEFEEQEIQDNNDDEFSEENNENFDFEIENNNDHSDESVESEIEEEKEIEEDEIDENEEELQEEWFQQQNEDQFEEEYQKDDENIEEQQEEEIENEEYQVQENKEDEYDFHDEKKIEQQIQRHDTVIKQQEIWWQEKKWWNKKLIIIWLVVIAILWLWFYFKDKLLSIVWNSDKPNIEVVKQNNEEKQWSENNNEETEEENKKDDKVKINVLEKEVQETNVSVENVKYVKEKISTLFPFYEIWSNTKDTLEWYIMTTFAENQKVIDSMKKIMSKDFKNMTAFKMWFKVKELTAKEITKIMLLEWEKWKNAINIMKQIYTTTTWKKIPEKYNLQENEEKLIKVLAKNLSTNQPFLDQTNSELKNAATKSNKYLLLLNNPKTKEYVSLKELFLKQRNIAESLLWQERIIYFDKFIDVSWRSNFNIEQDINITKELIKNLRKNKWIKAILSKTEQKEINDMLKNNKKLQQQYDFLNEIEFYYYYLQAIKSI